MAGLTFADSHNMVAYLEKSIENANFVEIVDFLNVNPIWYALTVSPNIYVSCIEQFWSTAKIKTINNETQIHAKVEGKTIVISKSSMRTDLQFNDEDSHEEMGEGSEIPTDPHHIPIIQPSTSQPQKKQSRRKHRKDTEIPQSSGPTKHIADEVTNEEHVPTQSNNPPLSRVNTLGSGEDRLSLKELMDLCIKLSDIVLDLETTKTAQAKEIASLKKRVKNAGKNRNSKPPKDENIIHDWLQAEEQEELTIEEKSKLFQQLLKKRRKNFAAKRAEERRSKPPTKAQQRSIMTTYLKNMAGWKPKDLKNKSFASVQELFENAMKRGEDLENLWKLVKAKHGNTRPEEGYESRAIKEI
ncbi:hypothetical protein Tco_1313729 [Tanacetum coccineum]